jgi:hypothetical protein
MKRWERIAFNSTALAVAASGFAYLWMKYLVTNDDPFAVVNHPWEPAMLALHVLASPPFILLFGIILNSHIMKKLKGSQRKLPNTRSGVIALMTFAAMTASGYLLQVITSERGLQALVAVHVTSGALFTGTYAVHLIVSWRIARARTPAGSVIREVA